MQTSLESIKGRINSHRNKIEDARQRGGHTSSMETEIKKWIKEAVKECLDSSVPNSAPGDKEKEPLISRKEVASLLGISLVTLNDWSKKGLPSHKINGRVYFQRSEVLEYIKSGRGRLS